MGRFIGVLTIFFTIYGALHLYLLIKTRRAFALQGTPYILLCLVLLILFLAPLQARMLENQGYHIFSVVMTWIGNLWMGALFLFICLALPIDLYHLIMGLLRRLADIDVTDFTLARRQAFLVAAGVSLLLVLYSLFEAHHIRTEILTVRSPKIPAAVGRVRIVQISDVHVGPMMIPARLAAIMETVKAAEPDILVSTGDLVDGTIYAHNSMVASIAGVSARLGKFAITGNHEFYAGVERAAAFTRQAGFTLLRDAVAIPTPFLVLVGVDDPAGGGAAPNHEAALLAAQPPDRFIVLLKHRPEIGDAHRPLFDLQLSGHTHKGQIFPFGLIVRLQFPLISGRYRIAPNHDLYVNRGSGTWGPPMRFLAPPEVTIIDLLPAQTTDAAPEKK